MNILIRKNLNAESSKDRSYSSGGKMGARHRKSHGGVHGNRTRESVFCAAEDHCCSYRTHLFLNTTNPLQDCEPEEDSSKRKSSVTFLKWAISSIKRKSSISNYLLNQNDINSSRKVSFEDCNAMGRSGVFNMSGSCASIPLESVKKAEPLTLTTIDKDCFIIPIACMDRFLPAGVSVPSSSSSLNILEIDDPKVMVIAHLMSPMEPLEPLLESPLSSPFMKQRQIAGSILSEMGSAKNALEGLLLADLEKDSAFPFLAYYLINKTQTDPTDFFQHLRVTSLRKFDPQLVRSTMCHTFDMFCEVAIIARPPLQLNVKRVKDNATGFIITIYKVFEGDDSEKFEKNWLYWTGARMIYRYLPKSAGLRKISLHKSQLTGDKLYMLIVECSNFMSDFATTAILIPALRARLSGYTGIYRIVSTL